MTDAAALKLREFLPEQPVPVSDAEIKATIERLAKLKPAAYERERLAEAKHLGLRASVLDDVVKHERGEPEQQPRGGRALKLDPPEPWPDPVDGASLLSEMSATFTDHLSLPDGAADALALWTLHSHAFRNFHHTPRLAIVSPEKQCGKSTLLDLLHALVSKPIKSDNITPAAVFRTVEAARPTLLIDEADSFFNASDELRGILNSGHASNGTTIRTVGDNHEPRLFSTWCPTAIAAIGKLPDTIMDRAIIVSMQRRRPDQKIKRLRLCGNETFERISRQCARWAADHAIALASANPTVPEAISDRPADNWRPLLAIADCVGGGWPNRARTVALKFTVDRAEADTARTMLLADLRDMFAKRGEAALSSIEIAAALGGMEDRPWPEWKNGKPISTRQLAKLLAPFDVIPKQIWTGSNNQRGYTLDILADAFARYLLPESSSQSASALEANSDKGSSTFESARPGNVLADSKTLEANHGNGSSTLADGNPVPRAEGSKAAPCEVDL